MMKLKLLMIVLFLTLVISSSYACTVNITEKTTLVSYSTTDPTRVSDFKYPNYAQNNLLFVKLLDMTISSDCENSTITPKVYVISPTSENYPLLGFETISIRNGTYSFEGLKLNKYVTLDKDVISYGMPLRIIGDYTLKFSVDVQTNGTYDSVIISPTYILDGITPLNEYTFKVIDTSNRFVISQSWLVVFGLLMFVPAIIFRLKELPYKLNDKLRISSIIFFSLGLTSWIILIFIAITQKQEVEFDISNFVSIGTAIFVPIFLAFMGSEFIGNLNKKFLKK